MILRLSHMNMLEPLLLIVVQIGSLCETFNLDIPSVKIYRGPTDSMFGFTVAQHRDRTTNLAWLLIGAPKADTNQPGVQRGGAVYRCRGNSHCEQVGFDLKGNHKIGDKEIGFKSGQMFGATVKSSADDSVILACAPRYSWRTTNKLFYGRHIRSDQPIGTCFVSRGSFDKFMEYSPCRTDYNHGFRDSGFCQVGVGADLSKDGRRTYLGAVGSKTWQGEMVAIVKANESEWDASSQFSQSQSEETGYYQFFAPPTQVQNHSRQVLPKIVWSNTATAGLIDTYLGYSVASGEFDGDLIPDAVAGMPRGENLKGLVIVFSSELVELERFTGEQIGAYFGYSLSTLDLDGDGRDDIAVGAPLFSNYKDEARGNEIGRVYIYYQTEEGKFEASDTLDETVQGGRFGLSLASIGDVNMDGYYDLAVGAPYGGPNEQGAVYIYNGGQKGITKRYSQVIYGNDPRINLRTFGFSLSGGKDLDGNGYPDLIVGAYDSDSATYFRSVPVIRVLTNLTFEPEIVSLDDEKCTLKSGIRAVCFSILVCMTYEGHRVNSKADFNVQFILDSKKRLAPRIFSMNYEGNHTLAMTVPLEVSKTRCFPINVYLREDIIDKKTSMDVDFRYSLADSRLRYIIDTAASTLDIRSAFIMRNCGPENVCIPDLEITVSRSNEPYVLGSASRIGIEVDVINSRNDSHGSTVSVQLPIGLTYQNVEFVDNIAGVEVFCSVLKNRLVKCDLGDPLPANTSVNFKLFFQVGRIDSLRIRHSSNMSLEFILTASSTDPEENLENNLQTISIPIDIKTELQVYGSSRPASVIYNVSQHDILLHKQHGQFLASELIHTFEVKNNGPSSIEEANIEILWPSLTHNGNPLLYLLDQPNVEGPGRCDFVAHANPLNLTFPSGLTSSSLHSAAIIEDLTEEPENYSLTNETDSSSEELDSNFNDTDKVRSFNAAASINDITVEPDTSIKLFKRETRGMYETCGNNKCVRIMCTVGPLTKKSTTFIHLRGLIYANTLRSLSSKGMEKLNIMSRLTGLVTKLPYNVSPKDLPQVQVEIITEFELNLSAVIPWWAYLLIILGGILILLLVVVLLYKHNFFKRTRPVPATARTEPERVSLNKKTIEDMDED